MDPFKYLNSFPLFGSGEGYKPGLERIKRLLDHFDNPQQNLKIIHLAGTNGKGSTAAILEQIYRDSGYKTGLYTSPHIFHFNERIKINGRAISSLELVELLKELKTALKLLAKTGLGRPSFFEIVTVLAFIYFQRHQAEIVILETGLGGRLDATNVIESPLISLITNISLEHSEFLGDTITEIAAEKAGIIKENSKIISSAAQKEVLDLIRFKASEKNTKFINLSQEYEIIKNKGSLTENIVQLKRKNKKIVEYQLSLLGKHQALNTALALRTVEELAEKFPVTEKSIKKSLKKVYLPGRMEKISAKPLVFLDGAHNPAAFKEIFAAVSQFQTEYKRLHVILSVLADKDLDGILKEFLNSNLKADFYLAENLSFRTISGADLKLKVEKYKLSNHFFENTAAAAEAAYNNAAQNDLIIAAGSFNTVFEVGISLMTKKTRGEEYE